MAWHTWIVWHGAHGTRQHILFNSTLAWLADPNPILCRSGHCWPSVQTNEDCQTAYGFKHIESLKASRTSFCSASMPNGSSAFLWSYPLPGKIKYSAFMMLHNVRIDFNLNVPKLNRPDHMPVEILMACKPPGAAWHPNVRVSDCMRHMLQFDRPLHCTRYVEHPVLLINGKWMMNPYHMFEHVWQVIFPP